MENTLTSLAFSMYSNKGVYALFLGSGISSAAGIPTGWKIIEDLVQKIAVINGEECTSNAEEWYTDKYCEKPDYSKLLDTLTQTSAERCNLMKPYFEPTEEESAKGFKKPTKAHKAIARLIRMDYVKVVVTTNFDRLLELALQEEGITPVVIKSEDDIDGMFPLVHNSVTIFKINGDYMDTRFLNTDGELSSYPDKVKNLFLSILNDFGIISCGWSAKWDIAIKDMIRSSSNYRFGSYWTHLGTCTKELEEIAIQRKGKTLQIQSGDTFFTELTEKIEALEKYNLSFHPLSKAIAVERLKKYIVREEYKIDLQDLITTEQERVFKNIQTCWTDHANLGPDEEMKIVIETYVKHIDVLLPLVINGSYWAKKQQYPLLLNVIKRIVELPTPQKSYTEYANKLYYTPALFLIYGIGISCIVQQKYDLLAELFTIRNKQKTESCTLNITQRVHCDSVMNVENGRSIWKNTEPTPMNNYVFKTLRPFFNSLIPNDEEYDDYFDLFEFLYLLNYRYVNTYGEKRCSIPARFRCYDYVKNSESSIDVFKQEVEELRDNFLPIKSGLFGGKYDNYREVVAEKIPYIF